MFKYNEKEKSSLFYNKLMKFNKLLLIPIIMSSVIASNDIQSNGVDILQENNISLNILLAEDIDFQSDFANFPDKFSKEDVLNYELNIEELIKVIEINNLFDKNNNSKEYHTLKKDLFLMYENKMFEKDRFISFEDRFKILNVLILLDEKEKDFFNGGKNQKKYDNQITNVLNSQEVSYDIQEIPNDFKEELEYLTFSHIDVLSAKSTVELEKIEKLNSLEKILNFENLNDIIYDDEIVSIAFEYMKEYQYFLEKTKNNIDLESSR